MKKFLSFIGGVVLLVLGLTVFTTAFLLFMQSGLVGGLLVNLLGAVLSIVSIFLIYLFYRRLVGKIISFILPVSLLIFPFFLLRAMTASRAFFDIMSCPAGWEMSAVVIAIFCAWPASLITLIISVIGVIKTKRKGLSVK